MRTQRLRHRVEIQERITTLDSLGQQQTTWRTLWLDSATPLDQVPAEVLTGPGKNAAPFVAGQQQDSVDARITLRWFPGLLPTHRIVWDGRVFDIQGIPDTDITARAEWRLKCTTGLSAG